jgi:arylsulfatase A-like enzyme
VSGAARRGAQPARRLVLAAVLAACALPVPSAQAQSPASRPNIVWISAEDLSPRLGAYGDPLARTPNLDRLAAEGVRFTRAFSTAAICAPSRSAIITGVHQNTLGTMHMRTTEDGVPELPGPYLAVPPAHVKAFTQYQRAAGYYTTNDAKTDYQFAPVSDPRQPLTAWDESGKGAHWRHRPDPDQPFFSVFNLEVTHESHVWADHPANVGRALVTDPAKVELPPYYPDTRAVREDLARHYDNIATMDRQVGEILRQLEEDGLLESTIVFYWGDHGDGLPRAKRSLYDSGLRVPLLIRWPGQVQPGTVDDELVSLLDLAPTVLSMAGVAIPAHMQGRVIVGPEKGPEPRYLFGGTDRVDLAYDRVRSARDRRWLYIRNFHPELPYALFVPYRNRQATMRELLRLHAAGKLDAVQELWMRDQRPPEELYDTEADPWQIRNLAADPDQQARLAGMRGAVEEWMERIDDQGRIPEAEMVQRMWPGGVQPRTGTPYLVPRGLTERPASHQSRYRLDGPGEVVVYVPTEGASIAYTTDAGESPRWKLYTGPILLERTTTLRVRAVRYGYAESEEVRATFEIQPASSR